MKHNITRNAPEDSLSFEVGAVPVDQYKGAILILSKKGA